MDKPLLSTSPHLVNGQPSYLQLFYSPQDVMNYTSFDRSHCRVLAQLLIGALLGLCLLPSVAFAQDDKAPASGRSSGGRGCGTSTMPVAPGIPALILMTPANQAGQTTSTRPTFAWFIRDAVSVPLEFRLYEQEPTGYKLVQEIKGDRLISSPGIMVLAPDRSTPELSVGKRYRWQVELVCNANRPSGNPFAESKIEVVALQPALKAQLQQTRDRQSQANLYAQANLWYDLLSAAFSSPSNLAQLNDLQLSLVNKVAISPTEQELLQSSKVHPVRDNPAAQE